MKTELKNCLSLYKIFYSCAFILILCAIHPIIYYEEIGSAIQSPIAFLTIIFCSDTYLMEVKSKRADVFHLYDQKKQLKVISQRVCVQILYLLTQTSHIKKWVRSLKINTLAHKIAVTQPFVHVIMLPAYILADDEQSWL